MEQRQLREEEQFLLEFSDALQAIQSREELANTIFSHLKRIFAYDAAILGVVETDAASGKRMVTVFANDFLPEMLRSDFFQRLMRRRFPLAGTPFEVLMEQPAPLIIVPEMVEQLLGKFAPLTMLRRIAGIQQALVAPLRVSSLHSLNEKHESTSNEAFGFLNLASKKANHFTEADRILYSRCIELCSTAIRNVFLYEQLETKSVEIALQMRLYRILAEARNNAIQQAFSDALQTILLTCTETLQDEIPCSVAGIIADGFDVWIVRSEEKAWTSAAMPRKTALNLALKGSSSSAIPSIEARLLIGEEFLQETTPEAPFAPLCTMLQRDFGIESVVIIPLFSQHSFSKNAVHLASFLIVGERQPFGFSEQDAALLTSCAPHICSILENVKHRRSISQNLSEAAQIQASQAIPTNVVPLIMPVEAGITGIIGNSSVLRDVVSAVRQVAPTPATVLLYGETGTGKERIARAVHELSPRHLKPFVAVNCAALPTHLIESELFGHEKGAFTGATERRIGKFELANGGTIFLDELGELSLDVQAKLLRVLQERELERVGGRTTIALDVRVIAATNRNLQEEVAAGRFRADVYYRLNVFPLHLPPLRERREDIPHLVAHFVRKYAAEFGKSITGIDYASLQVLQHAEWQGNIRELENIIERSMIVSTGNILRIALADVPYTLHNFAAQASNDEPLGKASLKEVYSTTASAMQSHTEAERAHIMRVLQETNWRVSGERGAAAILKMKPTTLEYRMKKLGIQRER